MTITTKQLRNLGGAAAVFLLLAGTADAQQMKAVGPEPGQCKTELPGPGPALLHHPVK
jgi:hypothetical protein